MQENRGLAYTQCVLAKLLDVHDILVTGTAVLPDEKCLSFKTEEYLLLSMFSDNCLWSDL